MSNRSAQKSKAVYESVLAAKTASQHAIMLEMVREMRITGCRECQMNGHTFTPATVALFGIVCLCQQCADACPELFAIDTRRARQVGRCKRCWEPITTNDNLAEQKAIFGTHTGYCTLCWNSRRVTINFPGTPKLVRPLA